MDSTVFIPERRCNKAGSPSKWGFKYYLDHLLGNDLLEKLGSKYDPSGKLLLFELRQKIEKQKINPKFLTIDNIRQLLRAIKRPDLYKYSTLLLRKLNCRKLPSLAEYQQARVNYLYASVSDYLSKNMSYAFFLLQNITSNFRRPAERNSLVYKTTKTHDTSKKMSGIGVQPVVPLALTCRRSNPHNSLFEPFSATIRGTSNRAAPGCAGVVWGLFAPTPLLCPQWGNQMPSRKKIGQKKASWGVWRSILDQKVGLGR